jgi:hypothetical protein
MHLPIQRRIHLVAPCLDLAPEEIKMHKLAEETRVQIQGSQITHQSPCKLLLHRMNWLPPQRTNWPPPPEKKKKKGVVGNGREWGDAREVLEKTSDGK